jgi:hypothetical protein
VIMKVPATLLLLASICSSQDARPVCQDKTGVAWALPFKEAQARARESGRLLLVKPIAFGTTADGGW